MDGLSGQSQLGNLAQATIPTVLNYFYQITSTTTIITRKSPQQLKQESTPTLVRSG